MTTTLLFLLVVSIQQQQVDGYASWLRCFVELDESEVIMNYRVVKAESAKALVEIEVQPEGAEKDTWTTKTFTYQGPTTLKARLKVPDDMADDEVQFVIETTKGGEFVGLTKQCEGKRAFSRSYELAVELKLTGEEDVVELHAGYATGFGSVVLTPRFKLVKQKSEEL